MKAMLAWFKEDDPQPALLQMIAVVRKIQKLEMSSNRDEIWELAGALLMDMEQHRKKADPQFTVLLRRLDQDLRSLIRGEERSVDLALAADVRRARSRLSVNPYHREVLILDDSSMARNFACRILREKYHVVAVADGKAALARITQKLPDLLIMDIEISDIRGEELVLKLRGNAGTAVIPILLLSSNVSSNRALKGGFAAVSWLDKPYQSDDLLHAVHAALAQE